MKKISLFALAISTSLALFSQNTPTLRTEMARSTFFGVKAGANFAKVDTDELPGVSVNNKTGLHGGLFANIPLGSGPLKFQPELLYNSVGAKVKTTGLTGTNNYEQDLSYISLPLMFQLRSSKGFFVELGPQASYLISAKGENDADNKDEFDSFEFGLNGGLGYVTRVGVGISARYSYGLTNIYEDGDGPEPDGAPEAKNRVIQVGLFYMFGANK